MQNNRKTNTGMPPKVELIWLATNLPAWPHSNKYAHSNNTAALPEQRLALIEQQILEPWARVQAVRARSHQKLEGWGVCGQKGKPTPPWKSSP